MRDSMQIEYSQIPEALAKLRENLEKIWAELRFVYSSVFGLRKVMPVVDRYRSQLADAMFEFYRERSSYPFSYIEHVDLPKPVPLLTTSGWMPPSLLDIQDVALELDDVQAPCNPLDPRFADKLKNELGRRVDNNTTFRLLGVKNRYGKPLFEFALGKYADYLNSCEVLTWELASAVRRVVSPKRLGELTANEVLSWLAGQLPLRERLDPLALSNRSAAVGINTLTVFAHSDHAKDVFLIHRRGTKVAEASGTLHVVPAGMFQPLNQDNAFSSIEFSIRRNILREFGEELLAKEELIQEHASVDPDEPFKTDDDLKKLKELFDSHGVDIRFLGCALDPVTLKPELLTLLVVNDDRRTQMGIRYRPNWEGIYQAVAFSKRNIIQKLGEPNLLSAGAGCLSRCVVLFDEVQSAVNELV